MSELLAWVLSTGSFAAVVLLTALAAKSFAGDAARGRRRCPRCWHELGPLPGEGSGEDALQRSRHCSECGFVAALEKDTLRTRRRVGVGILSIVGVLAVVAAARIRSLDAGFWSMAPTRVLLLSAPFVDGSGYKSAQDELATRIGSMQLDDALLRDAVDLVVTGDGGRAPGSEAWSASYDSVWSALIRALPREDPLLLRFLEIPPNLSVSYLGAREGRSPLLVVDAFAWWPMGIESRLAIEFADGTVRRARFNPASGTNQLLVELPPDTGPGNRIRLVMSVRPLGTGDEAWREYPVVFTQIPEVLGRAPKEPDAEPVDSPELHEAVRSVFYPDHSLTVWSDGSPRAGLQFNSVPTTAQELGSTLFGLRVEILENGVVRRTSRIWWSSDGRRSRARWLTPIEDIDALARLAAQDPSLDANWTVRITGDKDLADYARPPIAEMPVRTKFKYWSGSMELPLKVQRTGAPSPMRRWSLEQ